MSERLASCSISARASGRTGCCGSFRTSINRMDSAYDTVQFPWLENSDKKEMHFLNDDKKILFHKNYLTLIHLHSLKLNRNEPIDSYLSTLIKRQASSKEYFLTQRRIHESMLDKSCSALIRRKDEKELAQGTNVTDSNAKRHKYYEVDPAQNPSTAITKGLTCSSDKLDERNVQREKESLSCEASSTKRENEVFCQKSCRIAMDSGDALTSEPRVPIAL
jgi:hypothetical protein